MKLLRFAMVIAVLLAFSFPQIADAGTSYWVVEYSVYIDGEWDDGWIDDFEIEFPEEDDDWWETNYANYTYHYENHWDEDLNENVLCLARITYSDSWVDSDGNHGSSTWEINFNCDH